MSYDWIMIGGVSISGLMFNRNYHPLIVKMDSLKSIIKVIFAVSALTNFISCSKYDEENNDFILQEFKGGFRIRLDRG
jgi:hypothetical protein